VTLVSLLSSYYEVQGEKRGLRKELERRAEVLGESLAGNVEPHLESGSLKELQRIVERFSNREHLAGVAVFNTKLETIAESSGLSRRLQIQPPGILRAIKGNQKQGEFVHQASGSLHILVLPLHRHDELVGALAMVHDAGYIDAQTAHVWREAFRLVLALACMMATVPLPVVR